MRQTTWLCPGCTRKGQLNYLYENNKEFRCARCSWHKFKHEDQLQLPPK
jgi:Zn ribbon nucleic-acid-binding protein